MKNKKYCQDCEIELSRNAFYRGYKRCRSCSKKGNLHPLFGKTGKNNPSFKGGKPKCIDCGKQLVKYKAKRCLSCANRIKNKGRKRCFRKLPKCINCNKQLSKYKSIRCGSCSKINFWKIVDKNKIMKLIFQGLKLKPNKPEKLLNNLLNKDYKYVGNGKFWIRGFNPDFININGQKKIIELYGDYWHNKLDYKIRDKRRLIEYKKQGYKTLIVWEHELKDLDKVKEKLLEFNKVK